MLRSILSLALCFILIVAGRADIVINEVMSAGSERLLRYGANGVPQYGFGTPWHSDAFNDGSWQGGSGPFGFGTFANMSPQPAIGTNTATQMQNLTPTLYLRKAFTLTAADRLRTDPLRLDVQFNDGIVCYINGVEVARRNAGPTNQYIYHDQFSAFGTPSSNESSLIPYARSETLTLPPANSPIYKQGANVLAIHVLNYWENTTAINTNTNAAVTVNNRDNFYFKGDLRIGFDPVALITNNSQWRYFPGVVEPSGGVYDPALLFSAKQSVPWGRESFDDALWSTGPAHFGAGSPNGLGYSTNLTTQLIGKATSVYFRIVFDATAADLADPNALQLLMDHDDAFVAYINGVEVARDRLGQANAFTPHTAVADSARGSGSPATYTIDPPARLLNAGPNVLAVQVHNLHLNDADFFFRARLQRLNAARILVDYNNTWRYWIGTEEPVQEVGDASEENPEEPDSQSDWVELHNTGTDPVNIGGWMLSDDPTTPNRWIFPAGTTIPASGYLLVICDSANITAPAAGGFLHTNFGLSRGGETLRLSLPNGAEVQQIPVPPLDSFQTYSRISAGQYQVSLEPTPLAANSAATVAGIVATPTFTPPGGFYSTTQAVTLSAATAGATIRYTLDGSHPTETTGLVYTGPISVSQPTANGPGTAIRAKAFRSGWAESTTATSTYLINQSVGRRAVPALCLTGDQQRALYRPYGVMAIAGGSWGNMSAPLPTTNNAIWTQAGSSSVEAADLSAYNNVIHRGRFTERPVVMEMIYPDGRPGPNIEFGLRISGSAHARPRYRLDNQNRTPGASPGPNDGAWSATSTQKPSFNFFFRNEFGGDPLDYPLFPFSPGVTKFHDLRCRAGKNDPSNPFIEDEFVRRLFVDLGQVGSTGIIHTLYVNGVYKGYYNLCEHLREEFFQQHHKSSLPWDVRQVTVVASGDGLAFQEMITYIRNNPQSTLANYREMKKRLDVVNFADYLIVNLFGTTGDWPHNNYVCARERSAKGLHRYYVWDAEGAFGDFSGNVRTNQFVSGTTGSFITTAPTTAGLGEGIRILYTLLRQSPEFKMLFADRLQKHFFNNGALTETKVLERWNAMKAEFQPVLGTSVTDRVTPWTNGVGDKTRFNNSSNIPSRRQVLFHGYFDDTTGGSFVQPHLVAEGLWPATMAPVFSHPGGTVTPGFNLTITNPNGSGTLYYTTNGNDPRAEGGLVGGLQIPSGGQVTIQYSTTVKARVLSAGGIWSPITEAFFYTGTPPPLLITEIMYHPGDFTPSGETTPVDGDEFEFLEVKNVGSFPLDLFGLRFNAGIDFTFPEGSTIPPNGFAILARNPTQFAKKYPGVPVLGSYGPGNLSNSGETLTLVDGGGNLVLSMTYGDRAPWPPGADGAGYSLVPMLPNSNPNPSDAANWRLSGELGGSPGADDLAPGIPRIVITELLANPATVGGPTLVELHNPGTADANIGGWFLSNATATPKKYRIPDDTIVPAGGYLVLSQADFATGPNAFGFSPNGGQAVLSSADAAGVLTGLTEFVTFGASEPGVSFGRHTTVSPKNDYFVAMQTPTFGAANSGPKVGPVVITEIHYAPLSGLAEFIEIRNNGADPIPLFDPANPANTWRLSGVEYNVPPGITIEPGQFIVFCSTTPEVFRATGSYTVNPAIPVYGPFAGELSNNGERLALQKPGAPFGNGSVPYIDVDFVTYGISAPWPVLPSGRTLERRSLFAFAEEASSWRSSSTNGGNVGRFSPMSLNLWTTLWLAGEPAAAQGALADADNDGNPNVIEYYSGLNPRLADGQDNCKPGVVQDSGASFLTMTFRRSLSLQNTTAVVEAASEVGTWAAGQTLQFGTAVNNGDGTETVTFRDTVSLDSATKRFLRLKVTSN